MSFHGILLFAIAVLGTFANAQVNCPDISGKYARRLQADHIQVSDSGSKVSGLKYVASANPLQNQSNEWQIEIKPSSPDSSVAMVDLGGDSYRQFILDGQDRARGNRQADNFFQTYNARCSGDSIIITESGSDNDTSLRRIDTYHANVVYKLLPNGDVTEILTGTMLNRAGSLVESGSMEFYYSRK